ncbi:MAG: hypothetical protein HUU35_06645 [Armatimonadetes bacterium]|nr:hypothetical protein [Armatimonadota bacterium]
MWREASGSDWLFLVEFLIIVAFGCRRLMRWPEPSLGLVVVGAGCVGALGSILYEALDGAWRRIVVGPKGLVFHRIWRRPQSVGWHSMSLQQAPGGVRLLTPLGSLDLARTVVGHESFVAVARSRLRPERDQPTSHRASEGVTKALLPTVSVCGPMLMLALLAGWLGPMYENSDAAGRRQALAIGALVIGALVWVASRLYVSYSTRIEEGTIYLHHRNRQHQRALVDLEVVGESAGGLRLRCGLVRIVVPLRSAAQPLFGLHLKEAVAHAKRRLAESEAAP